MTAKQPPAHWLGPTHQDWLDAYDAHMAGRTAHSPECPVCGAVFPDTCDLKHTESGGDGFTTCGMTGKVGPRPEEWEPHQ